MVSKSFSWIARRSIQRPWPLAVSLAFSLAAPAAGQGMSRVAQVRSLSEVRGATLANASEDLATVDDLLVDVGDGSVTSLIVTASTSSGRRAVEVPYALVTWSETGRNFLVDMPRSELDRMPSFRSEDVELFGESAMPKGMPMPVASGSALGSELSAFKIRFLGGAEDKLRGVSVELYTGELAFVTVSSAGDGAAMGSLHPLPWNAFAVLGVAQGPGRDPIPEATLRIDRARLAEAPSLRDGKLDDPDFRAKVYRFHHVPTPRFETLR